jgi:hypothetical protein
MGISSTSQTAPVQHPPPWTPRSNRAPSFARCGEPSAPRVKKGKRSLGRESLAGRQGNPLRPEEDRPRWVGPDIECLSNMRLSSHLLQQGRFNMPGIHGTCPSSMESWIEVQYSMSLDTHRLRKPPNAPSMPPSREICASRTPNPAHPRISDREALRDPDWREYGPQRLGAIGIAVTTVPRGTW